MSGYNRHTLNNTVMLIVLFIALKINLLLPSLQDSIWYIPFSMLTATGAYVFLIKLLFMLVSNVEFLKRIYWGKLYLDGYWSYKYSRDGKEFFGIWRFEQDLDSIKVIGNGLNENYLPRTIVSSVSPLIKDQGEYFVLNVRKELEETAGYVTPVYSKTTLILDTRRGFKPVITMRATTQVYGGSSTGQLHPDVIFKKHVNAKCDQDVIEELKR